MQRLAAFSVLASTSPAWADPGHLAEQAGHSHYVALGAFAAALVIAVVAAARAVGRRRKAALND